MAEANRADDAKALMSEYGLLTCTERAEDQSKKALLITSS